MTISQRPYRRKIQRVRFLWRDGKTAFQGKGTACAWTGAELQAEDEICIGGRVMLKL